ncbi:MAG TPA: hypothetical protein VKP30_23295, partial [Polyangiaceae bacterium]|nr:hypothetical protein [Polyangiaceae bacterium]
LIECALDEKILTLEQLMDGIGFERIAECLPPEELRRLVVDALRLGRRNTSLTEQQLLQVIPLSRILKLIPLEVIWQHVILDRIAKVHNWVEGEPAKTSETTAPLSNATAGSAPAASSASTTSAASSASAAPRSSKRAAAAEQSPAAAPERAVETPETPASDSPAGDQVQDEARARAISRLKEIDRLPPRFEELSNAILLSIESMYEELLQANSDEERSECIRDSFPNDAQLRTAMFALAELLEPSIDVSRPPICDADTDALVKLVVFEERKRKEGDGGMRRSSVRPPPLPMGRSASSIPAARVSVPPKNER